jgi:hypothetical protein
MATCLRPQRLLVRNAVLLLGWGAAVVCGWSSSLKAQDVRLRPYAGLSLPTRVSVQNGLIQLGQRLSLTVGSRLTVTWNQRFQVVTGIAYSPGYVVLHAAGRRVGVASGSHLLTATADARYWLLPPTRTFSWEVHTALGVVFGGQLAYKDLFESSTVSGIVGTMMHYQIGRVVGFRLRVQDRLYRLRFGEQTASRSKSLLRISFGLDLPFRKLAL